MNKYSFISELMDKKHLTPSQKERLYRLVVKEVIKNHDQKDNSIFKELRIIKEKIELLQKNISVKNISKQNSVVNRTKVHSPKDMISFLYKFSSDDQYKWFTHEPDLKIQKINYLSRLESFNKIKIPFNINYATAVFTKSFFLKNQSYGDKLNIYYPNLFTELTYHNEKVLNEISKGNSPFEIVIEGTYFVDIVNRFKQAIEFRLDNDKYKFITLFMDFVTNNLSIDVNEKYTEDFKNKSKSLSTYIDVNNFFRGINIILERWVNKYKSLSNELVIDLGEKNDYYLLTIFHKGSKIIHEPSSPKLSGTAGDLNTLRKYWFSVVDLEIQADFTEHNRPHKIICLDKETKLSVNNTKLSKNVIEPFQNSVGGVKYLIKIYKNN